MPVPFNLDHLHSLEPLYSETFPTFHFHTGMPIPVTQRANNWERKFTKLSSWLLQSWSPALTANLPNGCQNLLQRKPEAKNNISPAVLISRLIRSSKERSPRRLSLMREYSHMISSLVSAVIPGFKEIEFDVIRTKIRT